MTANTTHPGGVQGYRYVIVGAGVAGASAADAIRRVDPTGSILLVGRERSRPYHRPALSKQVLRGEATRDDLIAQPIGWIPQNDIELRTGVSVTRLEPDRRRVALADGTVVAYEQCVLAYGATVAPLEVPGAGLPGLFYLRTLDDAQQLLTRVKRAESAGGGKAIVVGGGFLGAEVAASLRIRGLAVQWILSGERPWHPVAGDAAGRWVASLMTDRGVEVVPNTQVRELLGDGRVQRVVLDDGSQVGCDFVVAAVGARVDSRPVAGTRITMGRAVVCDGLGRTGAQGIWAAGDCAVIADDRLDGKPAGAAHWEVAHAQGVHVGTNAARVVTGQDPLPWAGLPGWHSELFGLDVIAWGHARPIDRRVVRGNPSVASPNFAELGIDADGRICHAIIVGRAPERAAIRQLVDTRRPVAEMEERLRNPSTPLD